MSEPHEDPVAHASTKITSYMSVAAMAAEAIAQVAAARARERAVQDERTASAMRAERHAAYAHARLGWAPMLDPKMRERTGVVDAGVVWARAQAWRPDPEAERATSLAEERLRELRPDVMERYDRLRTEGAEPVDAMRRVAPLFDAPPARTGEPGADRAALTETDTARRAADAELTLYRGASAVANDPRTARIDERTDAVAQAHPHLARSADSAARAHALRTTPPQTPAGLAAEGYPKPINEGSVDAAKAAAAGRPVVVTPVQTRTPAQQTTAGQTR